MVQRVGSCKDRLRMDNHDLKQKHLQLQTDNEELEQRHEDLQYTNSKLKNVNDLKQMREYTFELPEIGEQKRISSVLRKIDEKIKNNRAINNNLVA